MMVGAAHQQLPGCSSSRQLVQGPAALPPASCHSWRARKRPRRQMHVSALATCALSVSPACLDLR